MKEPAPKQDWFQSFSSRCSTILGSRWIFSLALLVVLIWAVSGSYFHYSDTWQLVINTGTTIVTFLMVFLIQNTQNRDAKAINLKLDEIIFALGRARNDLIDAEKLSDEELEELAAKYARIRKLSELRRQNRGQLGRQNRAESKSKDAA